MQNTVNERIRMIAESLFKGNVNELCRAFNIKQATMSNIVSGRMSKPSYEVILAIVENSEVSADWLITGEGEMLRTPSVSQSANGDHNMQVAGNANNVHSSPDAARLLNLIESQQRTIERQAATIENLSRR